MEGPYPRHRGKRSFAYHGRDYEEFNGRPKRSMVEDSRGGGILSAPPLGSKVAGHGETVFRLICPESRVGCVIGKGGSIIKSLRQETGATIMIADAVEGADERVIFISSFDGDRHKSRSSRDNDDADKTKEDADKDNSKEELCSPAQEALLKIHSQIVDGGDLKGGTAEEDPSQVVITRLLVPNSQVGCLLGKGGRVIEQMRDETNTRIRILSRDHLPHCTLSFDEILQIVGDAANVKKAIRLVAKRLYENPALEHIQFSSVGPRGSDSRAYSLADMDMAPRTLLNSRRSGDLHHQRPFVDFPGIEASNSSFSRALPSGTSDVSWPGRVAKDELVFRMLCANEKIGGIIGRGGNVIRGLQEDIGVRIKVLDPVTGCNERVILVKSVERLDDGISPAQEALLHLQSKVADLGLDEDAVITSRLLVPSDQVGCLLGKGGSVISEIRRSTRANIRILGKDDLPKCALSGDELVQIVGDIRVAREALMQVSGRLRRKHFEERLSANPGDFPRLGIDSGPPTSIYQTATPPSGSWTNQDLLGGRSLRDSEPAVQQAPNFRLTGALVTRTTMELVIPAHAITAIIGDGGSKIVQIRQMSGAKVDLLDVRSGASEGVVKISGTPEQTQAAQNMLQELILKGHVSHGFSGEFYSS